MLVPEQYAWIGDPISLGKAGARNRLCSTIEFATLDERALTAVRWDTGTTEEIAVSALLRVGQGEPLSTPHA